MRLHRAFNATVSLPKGIKSHKFSMVYGKDVAKAIAKVLEDPHVYFDKIINLAFKEDITLTKVLSFMQRYYGLSEVLYDHDDEKGLFRYPTAERGAIDCSNAEILLDWNPTSFDEAATATCKFFEEAMVDPVYAKERELALVDFIEETLPESFNDEKLFVDILTRIYGPAVFRGIDIGLGDVDPGFLLEAKSEL